MAKEKSNNQKYVKLSQIDHILLRPDTYVGTVNTLKNNMNVIEDIDLNSIKVIKKEIDYNAAFIKIFDEILSNASDASIRTGKVSYIKINIDKEKVSVENDGPSIPVEIHTDENIYIPQLIFSTLLTGSNFDDNEERVSAGRNGMGSKLTNVFSIKFIIDCCDGKNRYKQIVKNNMKDISEPSIKSVDKGTKSFTKITYYPDVQRFGLPEITEDSMSLMMKRCLDIAVYNPNVRVSVNNKTLPVKSVKDFMKMHLPTDSEFFYEKLSNGWEVGVAKSSNDIFEQISIVNGTSTIRGGTHVSYIGNQLSKDISERFGKKVNASWADVRNKICLFLICRVPNPEFDTQTKENLTNYMSKEITSGVSVGESTIKKIMKSEIVESILREIEQKEKAKLKKLQQANQKLKVEKLIDANSKDRSNCQLFIFEGDCIEESTMIKIIRNDTIMDIAIKNVEIDDTVFTHNNRFRQITSVNKKIGKKVELKTNSCIIGCTESHKWFVYDSIKKEFYFTETSNLDKTRHKLVKNYIAMMKSFFEIDMIKNIDNETKFKYSISLSNNETIDMTPEHKTACYDLETEKFHMICAKDLDKEKHLLMNIS